MSWFISRNGFPPTQECRAIACYMNLKKISVTLKQARLVARLQARLQA